MEVLPVQTPLVRVGDDVVRVIEQAVREAGLQIEDGDILLLADKIVATSEGRVSHLDSVEPSAKAKSLAQEHSLEPSFVELVLREAEEVLGGVPRALLTIKDNVLIANAGIDHKNAPERSACLWSTDPHKAARRIWKALSKKLGKKIGVILVDSHVNPMRLGTTGFALGIAGIEPIRDCRGMRDLYNREVLITRVNVADDLAAAAHLVMGEVRERTPLVIVRGAPVQLTDEYNPNEVYIPKDDCLFMSAFLS